MVLLENALHQTRILVDQEIWPTLVTYEAPHELGTSSEEERLVAAKILCPVSGQPEKTELVPRFEEIARRVLRHRKVEAKDSASEILDQLFETCGPIGGFPEPAHYLWKDPKHMFRTLIGLFATYLRRETETIQTGQISVEFARKSLGRPERNSEFAQQFCTLQTSFARAEKFREYFPDLSKILVLGDDDLLGLALTEKEAYQADVFEIDRPLVRFIKKRGNERLKVFSRDLNSGLPSQYCEQYDAAFADPAYSVASMDFFLRSCVMGLKRNENSRLFLSNCPELSESPSTFQERIAAHGLVVEESIPGFSKYCFLDEFRAMVKEGLLFLGYHPKLIETMTAIPYLYATLYVCRLAKP